MQGIEWTPPSKKQHTAWDTLALLIRSRTGLLAGSNGRIAPALLPPLPGEDFPLKQFILEKKLGPLEYWALFIALAPHQRPHFLDTTIRDTLPEAGDFPQIGGMRGKQFRGFLPTGETLLFLLGGDTPVEMEKITSLFEVNHVFAREKILWLEPPPDNEPFLCGKVVVNPARISLLTTGKNRKSTYNPYFLAQTLSTKMTWGDLVLNTQTMHQIDEIRTWMKFNKVLVGEMGMGRKLKPGYRALFYGPPGTGKTLTATLLGQEFDKPVYRVDLSMVVSKFIGETEKNLSRLFDEAEYLDCVLFFDEADALFGRRTQVKDAHDRFANQEVSYLMQRIELFEGLVVLATNLKGNMDEAFARRFQSVIYFPHPTPNEQLEIWKKAFPEQLQPATETMLQDISLRYKLSGSNIMNITHYSCLEALSRGLQQIPTDILLKGVQRELSKENRSV